MSLVVFFFIFFYFWPRKKKKPKKPTKLIILVLIFTNAAYLMQMVGVKICFFTICWPHEKSHEWSEKTWMVGLFNKKNSGFFLKRLTIHGKKKIVQKGLCHQCVAPAWHDIVKWNMWHQWWHVHWRIPVVHNFFVIIIFPISYPPISYPHDFWKKMTTIFG